MTRAEALELIERMPFITTIQVPNDKIRMEFYEAFVGSNDPLEWIKVIKSCYVRTHTQSGKKMTVSEQEMKYAADAKKRLEFELAEALNIREDEVENYINNYLAENM